MKNYSHNYELSFPTLILLLQLLLSLSLGILVLIHPGIAVLLSVIFFVYLYLFLKIETGFHLLIFFVPIGSLMIRSEFIERYLPYTHNLRTVDNQNLYHLIFIGVILSLLVRISAGNFKSAPLDIRLKNGILFIFALLATWASFTMLWAPHKVHGAIHLFQLLINIILFFIPLMVIKDEKTLKRAMLAWILIGIAFAIGGTIDRMYAQSIEITKNQRSFDYSLDMPVTDNFMFSFASKINTLRAAGLSRFDNASNMINMTIPLLLCFIASSIATKKQQYLGLQLSCLSFLIFARALIPNKSGLGAYIISLSFFILTFKPIIRRKNVILGLLLLISATTAAFIVANIIFPDATGVLWLTKTVNLKEGSSATTRVDWWTEAARLVVEKTHFRGLGMGGFKYYIEAPHPHSFILSFFFDMGIVGLFCILSLMAIIAFNFYRPVLRQESRYEKIAFFFAISLMAFLIQGTVDFEYYMPEFWLFSGTAVAAINLVNLDNKTKLEQI